MSPHVRTDAITARFTRWIERFEPRKALREKPQALADELNALLRIVLKAAPSQGYEGWLEDVLERLDLTMTTSAWSTTGQLAASLDAPRTLCSGERRTGSPTTWTPDPYALAARRIQEGEPVGQEWLFGRNAEELLRRGLVAYDDLERYRRTLRRAEEGIVGPERAAELERERGERRYRLGTPVDGRGAGTFGQMGKAAPEAPTTPWYHDTESPAYVRRMRELGRARPQEADWERDFEAEIYP